MNFEEWWEKEIDMVFTSTDACSDAYEAASQAWDAAIENARCDQCGMGLTCTACDNARMFKI